MRIYDNKTPGGRKVAKPEAVICPRCQGKEGRHVLMNDTETSKDAQGRNRSRRVIKQCPNDTQG